jgi:hypothetical protein
MPKDEQTVVAAVRVWTTEKRGLVAALRKPSGLKA